MTSIIGISGSLRTGSFNSALLRAAAELSPSNLQIDIKSILNIPVYNQDVEDQGIPESVRVLKEALANSKGLLLVTPEYNNSVPGVLKNAIDWMSRPSGDISRVFHNRPVALMGASNGGGGTRLSQAAWLPVFRTLNMRPWFGGTLYLERAQNTIDENGHIADEKMRARIKTFLEGFHEFIETQYRA